MEIIRLNGENPAAPAEGQYSVPDNITSLPALARAHREFVRVKIPGPQCQGGELELAQR